MRRKKNSNQSGQSLVEFALSILFVLFLIFAVIELTVFIYTYNVLADGAKEGVRYAIVHGTGVGAGSCSGPGGGGVSCTDSTGANIQGIVSRYTTLSLHDSSAMTVSPTYPDSSSVAPNRVRVTVSFAYQPIFGFGWPSVTVRAAAEGRIAF